MLDAARARREAVAASGSDIYEALGAHPHLVYTRAELEVLLAHELAGVLLTGPIRTRSKVAKQTVAHALGYPVPSSFRKVRPRFPGQDLDVYVQQHDNLQIWNEELSPTRRYVLIRVNEVGTVVAVRVAEGTQLATFDTTGTLTSKYQAKRRPGSSGDALVTPSDTATFAQELAPVDALPEHVLSAQHPGSAPVRGAVLTIRALYERLLHIKGKNLEYSSSERLRGARLHQLACEALGLASYADTGRFPDVVSQALEVKLQTSPTIDLGLISPDSTEPAVTLSPLLVHSDARYLVAYGVRVGDVVRIDDIVVSTGATFFTAFQRFGGLVQNRKLQLHLPGGFFDAE